jgi:hypothetical protein
VDEKSQIQALDRTAPILPLRPGLPEKATHDYKRNGTTTLFAALEVATGKVTERCYDRHGKAEFGDFLKKVARAYPRRELHIVVDNYHTHKHAEINYPTGHPARIILQRQRTRHIHQSIHRRLERTLPSVHLDQDRRRNPAPRPTAIN